MQEKEILRGWKEIERYLGITRITIRRNGYPIRSGKARAVFAFKCELDEFLRDKSSFFLKKDQSI